VTGLLTADGTKHVERMSRAIAPCAGRLDRSFRAWLRKGGYDQAQVRALMAITPAAAARLRSLGRFLEQVDYSGGRLAKLNVSPLAVAGALEQFDQLLAPVLEGRFAAAREHLQLVVQFVLQKAFYQVREAESQTFFGLYHAEAAAADLDDLLRRFVAVLAKALRAAAGWLLLREGATARELSRPLYIERGQANERLIGDPKRRGRYACYWSYPLGPSTVMQLGFTTPYPWLPREQALLSAAAARCWEAMERVRMVGEIRRLEVVSRQSQEEERHRIGRDLHDEVGQVLAFLRLELDMLEREAPACLRRRLGESRDLAGRTAVELRRVVAALSPSLLDRLGLEAAIRHLAARFRRTHGTELRLRASLGAGPVGPQTEEAIYRVAQECLQNVARHSRATRVNISLRSADKNIRLSVTDNGAGFCAEKAWRKPKSFGLTGMRERAGLLGGTFEVRSAPGKGTKVMLELPLGTAPVRANGKNSHIVN
jgi:two-component system sensor histidine kinase UhpB